MKWCVQAKKKNAQGKDREWWFFLFQNLVKVEDIFLNDEKIVFTLNTFFVVVSFCDVKISLHDSVDGTVRILGRQGVHAWFAFEVNALLDTEGLGKVK